MTTSVHIELARLGRMSRQGSGATPEEIEVQREVVREARAEHHRDKLIDRLAGEASHLTAEQVERAHQQVCQSNRRKKGES